MIDHVDAIMAIMNSAFDPRWGEAWTRRQITDSLTLPNTHYLLVDADGEAWRSQTDAAGFLLSRSAPGEEELLLIAVSPPFRGGGLGRQLLETFKSDAKQRGAERVFLEMRCNNPAEKLYRLVGFEPIGKRANYYRLSDGSKLDAITFGHEL